MTAYPDTETGTSSSDSHTRRYVEARRAKATQRALPTRKPGLSRGVWLWVGILFCMALASTGLVLIGDWQGLVLAWVFAFYGFIMRDIIAESGRKDGLYHG